MRYWEGQDVMRITRFSNAYDLDVMRLISLPGGPQDPVFCRNEDHPSQIKNQILLNI